MPEGDLAFDFAPARLGVGKSREPLRVKRCHHFGGNDRVDSYAVVAQRRGPFARQRQLRAFGRAIAACRALASNRCFRGNVDDRAA